MNLWYSIVELLPFDWAAPGSMMFMKNALLGVLILGPLFGLLSTMIVTGKLSFFSDALGHCAFTGIAIGVLCRFAFPLGAAIVLSVVFALLFSYVRSRGNLSVDTVIGVFSSTAVALGIFLSTLGGGSFTKFNRYLIGDILSVTPREIGFLALVLLFTLIFWALLYNHLLIAAVHPQLAASRGIATRRNEMIFTAAIAVVVTLSMSWVGMMVINSLLILPSAGARNIARNQKEYHLISILSALFASIGGLMISYRLGASTGASISLLLALYFAVTFLFRRK